MQGTIPRQFIRYVTATVASLLVFSLYTIVDGLFVARGVGDTAMGAVNLAAPFTNLLFSLAVLFAVGTSTLIAVSLGQGDPQKANRLFSQNLMVVAVLGILISILTLSLLHPFALALGARADTLPYVMDYLRGWVPFAVCVMVSYNMEILVKTDGHPRLALITVTVGCLSNCLMDYIAIFLLRWGVFGAAVATGLSQLLTCVIYLRHFLRGGTAFRLCRFRFDIRLYKKLLPLGFSDGVTELCTGVMVLLFNRTVLRYLGQDGLVVYAVIAYVGTLIINTTLGVSQGMQPLVSYYHGRKEHDVCRELLRCALIATASVTVLAAAITQGLAPRILTAFLGEMSPALRSFAVPAFRQYSLCFLLVGFNILLGGFMTAVERPTGAICLSVGRGLVIQGLCLVALAALTRGCGIWFAPLLSEAVCLVMALLFLRRYKKQSLL